MEWVKPLRGKVVGLDTAPLIYFIEENLAFLPLVRPFFEAVDRGEFQLVTSVLTLTEVLVHPMRKRDSALADLYRQILLGAEHVSTMSVSEAIAEEAARLRSLHGLRTPDAIHLSSICNRRQKLDLIRNGGSRNVPLVMCPPQVSELRRDLQLPNAHF
jgi:predicted nucleic acid-binding protein